MTSLGWQGRYVHVSSFAVYALNQRPAWSVVDESVPIEPYPARRDDYAWGEVLQERLVDELMAGPSIPISVVRPGAIFGPERQFQYRLGRQLRNTALLLFGGHNPMPLVYIENVASLLAEVRASSTRGGRDVQRHQPDADDAAPVSPLVARLIGRTAEGHPGSAGGTGCCRPMRPPRDVPRQFARRPPLRSSTTMS